MAEAGLRDRVIEAIRSVYDPEIPVNIYELGLVYEVTIDADNEAYVLMTLTSPSCPVAEILPPEVQLKVEGVEGVSKATVEITWDPPWSPDMMSEAAKLELGML
jgi:FeS assembly SUF system protein